MSVFQKMAGRGIRQTVLRHQRMNVSSEEVAEKYAQECLASRIYANMRDGWKVLIISWPTFCRPGLPIGDR